MIYKWFQQEFEMFLMTPLRASHIKKRPRTITNGTIVAKLSIHYFRKNVGKKVNMPVHNATVLIYSRGNSRCKIGWPVCSLNFILNVCIACLKIDVKQPILLLNMILAMKIWIMLNMLRGNRHCIAIPTFYSRTGPVFF